MLRVSSYCRSFLGYRPLVTTVLLNQSGFTAPHACSLTFFNSPFLQLDCELFEGVPPIPSAWDTVRLTRVQLFASPWTVAHQAPPSVEFSWQEYWVLGCHFLLQGLFLTQGSNPGLPHCRQTLYRLSHQGNGQRQYPVKKCLWD